MTYSNYKSLVAEAANSSSDNMFIAEYGYPADSPYSPETLIKMLRMICAVARRDIVYISEQFRTRKAFSEFVGVKYDTVLSWISGERTPPEYLVDFIGFALISELPTEE